MNWFQKISQVQIFWHATTANLADEINDSGVIKPGIELDERYQGWNFPEEHGEYGDGVYLATTADLALYYANLRLERERDEFSYYPRKEIELYDESLEYLGLYKIYVMDQSRLVPVGQEFKYQGSIPKNGSSGAWYEFANWVARTRDAKQWRGKLEEIDDSTDR